MIGLQVSSVAVQVVGEKGKGNERERHTERERETRTTRGKGSTDSSPKKTHFGTLLVLSHTHTERKNV